MVRKKSDGVTRRDFLNGVAVSLTSAALPPSEHTLFRSLTESVQRSSPDPTDYPPVRSGMRGSHEGSFELAHAMRDGQRWSSVEDTGESYDLVVVGGGISGLSAAHFYKKRHGAGAKILILDNHDDFGGHAKRNELWHDGRMYLMNGGTLNVEAPSQYSTVAGGLLWDLGIDRTRYFRSIEPVRNLYRSLGLRRAMFFDRETFEDDRLVAGYGSRDWSEFLAEAPLTEKQRSDLLRLLKEDPEMLGLESKFLRLPDAEKKSLLASMSYSDYLTGPLSLDASVVPFLNSRPMGIFCTGIDALPALYAWEMGYPGFESLELVPTPPHQLVGEPGGAHGRESEKRASEGDPDLYFPDGNATIARLLVSSLISGACGAKDMEEMVTAPIDYGRLDEKGPVKLRLNSTVVRVAHDSSGQEVEILYGQGRSLDSVKRVKAGSVVMACWNYVIPHLCPELSSDQKSALADGVKAPLVYTSVLIRNWQAFAKLKTSSVTAPGSYHTSMGLGPSLRLGDYTSSQRPETPIVVRMSRYPCSPGLARREQHRVGQLELLSTSFSTFEERIRDQMDRVLSKGGFEADHDILAITVNRWPHGYAYNYNTLYDPVDWALTSSENRPVVKARRPFGRIAIANADAAASPHTDAAIDQAYRAVQELTAHS